jgi:hypothetical protein
VHDETWLSFALQRQGTNTAGEQMDPVKFEADLELMRATTSKQIAEQAKLTNESHWMSSTWGATTASLVIGAAMAVAELLH